MHEYDVAFKLVLQQSVDLTIREITGTTIVRWHNVELPEIRNTRVDLLGETTAGELVHIELQSTNESKMVVRMAEYSLRVFRLFGRFPEQIFVYVGNEPLKMDVELNGPSMRYSHRIVDIGDLDGERLLESAFVGDNIVALLARLPNLRKAVQRVLERISRLPPDEREISLRRLLILAGLRKAGAMIEEEVKKMPILDDIMDHEVLGREYKKGLRDGVRQGVQQGAVTVLRRQIKRRFGALPISAEQQLSALSTAELEALSLRVLDASSIEDLLPPATV